MDTLLRNRGVFRVSVCGQEELEQLSRDGSHYSLSTGILPSLGARSNRRVKLNRFIISPYDRRYRWWHIPWFSLLGFKILTTFFFLCVCVGGFESSLKALSLFSFGIWKSTMLLVLPLPKRIYNIHIILFCLESQVQSGKYFQFGDGSLLDPHSGN